jgi:hypothetical protein
MANHPIERMIQVQTAVCAAVRMLILAPLRNLNITLISSPNRGKRKCFSHRVLFVIVAYQHHWAGGNFVSASYHNAGVIDYLSVYLRKACSLSGRVRRTPFFINHGFHEAATRSLLGRFLSVLLLQERKFFVARLVSARGLALARRMQKNASTTSSPMQKRPLIELGVLPRNSRTG